MQVEIRRADVCSLPIAPQDALMKIIAIEAMHRQAEHPNTGDFTIRSNLFHSGEQAMTQEQLRVVADYGDLCGEGPLWDSRSETLYWTDAVGRKFYRYDWSTQTHRLVKEGFEIYGFALNDPGGFVVTNNAGIWLWDGLEHLELLVAEVDGFKCSSNDCIADPAGRFFAGSHYYDPAKEYPLGHLVRVDPDGRAQIVDEGIHLANGLGFSPDCRKLYFTDSAERRIYFYDYNVDSGEIRNRRVLVQVPAEEGLPDGLTVDTEGFIWSAHWYGGCVVRYDPDGTVERRVAVPAKQTSSLIFGGPDLTDIFITSAARSEVLPIMPPGYDPQSGYAGGKLYHVNLGITGKPEFRARMARRFSRQS